MSSCQGLHRVLTGDEGGAGALAVIENLEEEAVLLGCEGRHSPVVDDQQVDSGQSLEQPYEAAVGLGQIQGAEKFGCVEIEGAESLPAGLVRQGAGQIGFAHAGGAGDDAVAMMADPGRRRPTARRRRALTPAGGDSRCPPGRRTA